MPQNKQHTDPNALYNAEVLRIAKILAEKVFVTTEEAARAMIAEMRLLHYQGYITGLSSMELFPSDDEQSIDNRNKRYNDAAERRGLIPSPEVTICDHVNCNYGRCETTNEPICGCCGAYVNTVMTEDEKQEDKQFIYDAAESNVHKVKERGYLCYNTALECDRPRSCEVYKCCAYSPEKEQK